jgi:outer membrane protein assembly factor BamB
MNRLPGILLVLLSLSLAACGTMRGILPGGGDDEAKPAELQPFAERVSLQQLWTQSVGEISDQNDRIQPLMVGSTLYAVSSSGRVVALDALTGERKWKRDLELTVTAGIGYGDGLVLIGNADGEVVALFATNGEPAWVGDAGGEVLASPEGGPGIIVVPTSVDRLTGLSSADGSVAWTAREDTPRLILRGRSRPLVVSDVVFSGFDNGKLLLMRLDNGQRLWEIRVGDAIGKSEIDRLADIDSRPLLMDDVVYSAAYQSRLVAIDAPSARIIWSNTVSTNQDIDASERFIYVTAEDDVVHAIDRRSGETAWQQDALLNRGLTAPAVVGEHVLVADRLGYLHLLNGQDGTIEGRAKAGSAVYAQAVSRENMVWLQTEDGKLIAWRVERR